MITSLVIHELEMENTAVHISFFFLIEADFKFLERGGKKHHAKMFTIIFTG